MTKRKPPFTEMPNPAKFIVQATDLSSCEVYRYLNAEEEPVLQGISLNIQRQECWGILGNEAFEVELLLEIIGCVRPYGSGRCILCERGMMRKKRRILPHVFYIADGDVTFPNMNTLEYLMFATAHTRIPPAERQIAILERLLDTGLHYLTLAPIRYLSRAQKAVICLLAASFSKALLIIASVSQLEFDEKLSAGIGGIARHINRNGGVLLLGAKDCSMVQAACTHAAFLIGGKINHKGSMMDMLSGLDKRVFIIRCDEPEKLAERIQSSAPELIPRISNREIHIYDYRDTPLEIGELMQILLRTGIPFESLQASRKTLENAYKEALTGYAL